MRTEGEPISNEDLEKYLKLLVGDEGGKALKPVINSDEFAENILGFEEVEEEEDEGFLDEAQQNEMQQESNALGMIPEEV